VSDGPWERGAGVARYISDQSIRRKIMAEEGFTNDKGNAPGGTPNTVAEEAPADTVVAETEAMRRRNVARANDDADGSHMGGMGAQGGAVDFGNPKNFGL
jgi:hypothetical protein